MKYARWFPYNAAWATWLVGASLCQPAAASAGSHCGQGGVAESATAQAAANDLALRRPGLQAMVEERRGVTRGLLAELRQVDQDLVAAASGLRQAEGELARVEGETQALEAQLAEKQAAVDARAGAYGSRLRALYKFMRTSPLEQLLAARDFGEALQRVTMMQAVTRVDHRLLGQLRAEQSELLKTREALQRRQAEVAALRDEIAHQQEVLVARRADQAALVARAQQEQSQAEEALLHAQESAQAAKIVALQARYEREIQALERQRALEAPRPAEAQQPAAAGASGQALGVARGRASAQPGAPPLLGPLPAGRQPPAGAGLIWPVSYPIVTTEFGEPTFAQSAHTGIDLAQRLYAPVVAAADGVVLECGLAVPGEPAQSYGMMVVLGHDKTLATLYAHLADGGYEPVAAAGDTVRRGQVIGYIGMTGMTTGPHLHFEVRALGQALDPRHYLPK